MTSRISRSILLIALASALGIVAAPRANAQEPPPPPPPAEPAVIEVSDEELTSFARAWEQAEEISRSAAAAAAAASTPEEAQAILAEADAAVEAAISAQGLSIDQYNEIAARVEADPALQERVRAILEQPRT